MPGDRASKNVRGKAEVAETRPALSQTSAIPFWMWCALAVSLLFALYTIDKDLKQRAAIRQLQAEARQQMLAQEKVAKELALARREALILTDSRSIKIAVQATQKGLPQLQVTWHPALGLVMLGRSIPVLPANRTLQLWFIPKAGGAQPTASLTFEPDTTGSCNFLVAQPPSAQGETKTLIITEEPKGGSPEPTTAPFWIGSVASK